MTAASFAGLLAAHRPSAWRLAHVGPLRAEGECGVCRWFNELPPPLAEHFRPMFDWHTEPVGIDGKEAFARCMELYAVAARVVALDDQHKAGGETDA